MNKLSFTLDDVKKANTLRRKFLRDIETLAIDEVYIYENTTNMPDETIAQRLGMVPIQSDTLYSFNTLETSLSPKTSDIIEAPDVDETLVVGKVRKETEFYLLEGCQKQETNYFQQYKIITTGMLKCNNPSIKVSQDDIGICHIYPGQKLSLRCTIAKGSPSLHTKWASAIISHYSITNDKVNLEISPIGNLSLPVMEKLAIGMI